MPPDYSSKVPFYNFPATLDEQEAALTSNPLMQRLIESRMNYAEDPHRPSLLGCRGDRGKAGDKR